VEVFALKGYCKKEKIEELRTSRVLQLPENKRNNYARGNCASGTWQQPRRRLYGKSRPKKGEKNPHGMLRPQRLNPK